MVEVEYSPDWSIGKLEEFNCDELRFLTENNDISVDDRKMCSSIYKNRVKGNKINTQYKIGGKTKWEMMGRLFPIGASISKLSRDLRNFLARKYYTDVDQVNAQPTIFIQLCEKEKLRSPRWEEYIKDREKILSKLMEEKKWDRKQAKEKILTLLYGGNDNGLSDFFKEMKAEAFNAGEVLLNRNKDKLKHLLKAENKEGKALSVLLQTIERNILLAMNTHLGKRGWDLAVFIHDGGLVRNRDDAKLTENILSDISDEIEKELNYKIKLEIKSIETTIEVPDVKKRFYLPSDLIVDDMYGARIFADLMGSRMVLDNGTIFMFDDLFGIWTSSELILDRYISNCGDKLIFYQRGAVGDLIHNYSGSVKWRQNLKKILPSILPSQDGYFLKRNTSAVGKLLFLNGIYDFETNTFSAGFDENIVFFNSVPRKFPKRMEEDIEFLHDLFFRQPFRNEKVGDTFLHFLARGIAGDFRMKKILINIGRTNCGKGLLSEFLGRVFGNCIGSFNGDSLLTRSGDTEATKSISWIKQIYNKRIAFCNEITIDKNKPKSINGNQLKMIASGGDEITLRQNFKDEEVIVNQCLPIAFCNDFPSISPVDDAINERIVTIPYSYSFVERETELFHKKADPTLKSKLQDEKYLDAFIFVIIDALKSWDKKPVDIPLECLEMKNTVIPLKDPRVIIEQNYEITHNKADYVSSRELIEYLRTEGIDGTDTALGRILTDLGIFSSTKKEGRKAITVRVGLRLKIDE